MSERSPTLREFNPTKDPYVDDIKSRTDEIIRIIRENPELDGRCASIAITNFEQAAMWAVKANFVPK
jgi:NADH:ubiquinone oxidoreductase subunit D